MARGSSASGTSGMGTVRPRRALIDPLLATGPFAVAKDVLLDLPGGGLGQVAELDRLRRFEVRDAAADVVDDLLLGRARPWLQGDERLRHLPPLVVGDRDDRTLQHRRMALDSLLDLDCRDVLAAGDDDVLLSVAQLDETIGVYHSDVARVEPAAAKRLLGGFRVTEIAFHHDVSAHADLAHGVAVERHRAIG